MTLFLAERDIARVLNLAGFFVGKQHGHISNEIAFNQDFWNQLNLLFSDIHGTLYKINLLLDIGYCNVTKILVSIYKAGNHFLQIIPSFSGGR